MLQIYINGKEVTPSENASIKLTCENPYFTKSASYTLDIDLPIDIEANRAVYGHICRIDMPKDPERYPCRIVADNIEVLKGEAHVTQVTESAVKVQLLGEESCYNYGNKADNLYVDELDMGDWYTETFPDRAYYENGHGRNQVGQWKYYPEGEKLSGSAIMLLTRLRQGGPSQAEPSEGEVLEQLHDGSLPWVAFPTYNKTAEARSNAVAYYETATGSRTYAAMLRAYDGERGYARHTYTDQSPSVNTFAIQPFIWKLAKLVAKATGYELDNADNALYTNTFYRKIFAVNTDTSIQCSKCLPHWTVNEFWTQIEQTFGLIMTIDYAEKRIKLLHRGNHYKLLAGTVYIKDVVDEYTSALDDDSETDISVNNTGYAEHENGPEDELASGILAEARRMSGYADADALVAWANSQSDYNLDDLKDVIFECEDGRQYIYATDIYDTNDGFVEVNMLRPRHVDADTDDVDIELKIVPARYVKSVADLYAKPYVQPGATNTQRDIPDGTFDVEMLQVPGVELTVSGESYGSDYIDIQAAIEEEEDVDTQSTSSADVLYMAIRSSQPLMHTTEITLNSGGSVTAPFYYPHAALRSRTTALLDTSIQITTSNESLSLIPISGQTSIGSESLKDVEAIGTKEKRTIKFVSDRIPNPGSIFIIRNRKFVCEKIEATLTPSGLDKLLTGYFYEFS